MADVLRGHLGGVALASVLQLVELECFCGELVLPSGGFTFFNGELVDARFLGVAGASAGVEAMLRARGPFALRTAEVAPRASIAPISSMILESCRLADELERVGSLPVSRVPERPEPGEFARWCRAPGGTVAARLAAAGLHVVSVLDPVIAALEIGAVSLGDQPVPDALRALEVGVSVESTPAPPPPPAAPASAPAAPADRRSFDELVFDARRLVRGRAWDEAEATLRRALELRPGSPIVAQNLNRVRSLRASE